MKKIAVLHAQIPFAHGGAELMVETLTNELKKRDYDAELISIPFRWYPKNGLYDNMLMWRMLDLREVNGEKIDLVIPTKFPTYGLQHHNKVMWLMHQHRAAYDLFNNKEHFGLGTIDHGQEMRDIIVKYDNEYIKEANKIYTISKNVSERLNENNGFCSEALYQPPALVGKYFCEEYGDYILSVGRLDPLKRIDLIIKALKYCDKSLKLKIAGKGPEQKNLETVAIKENVADRVDFLGFVDDQKLLELYAGARCVYFAPIDEDYGYITLEAFLSRKPIITCKDSGGVLEFVTHDKNGFVCEDEPMVIGQVINNLNENLTICEKFGENGYNVVKDITWDNVVQKLTENI